jgi:hypothetical protein
LFKICPQKEPSPRPSTNPTIRAWDFDKASQIFVLPLPSAFIVRS